MNNSKAVFEVAINLVVGIALIAPLYTYEARAQQCDTTLWQHVYKPMRLTVMNECMTVSGTIVYSNPDPDGDFHLRMHLDPKYSYLLKPANAQEGGNIVVEPICQHPPTQPDAIAACKNFHQDIIIPAVGSHVNVTGSYVLDRHHGGWAEIHPVTSIVNLTS